jgi:hypothetical protein
MPRQAAKRPEADRVYPVCTSLRAMTACTAVPRTRDNRLAMREAADGIRTHDLLHEYRARQRPSLGEFREQIRHVERGREHRDPTLVVARPSVLRTVPVELEPVAIGIP